MTRPWPTFQFDRHTDTGKFVSRTTDNANSVKGARVLADRIAAGTTDYVVIKKLGVRK